MSSNQFRPLSDVAIETPADARVFSSLLQTGAHRFPCTSVESWRYEYIKRAFDFVGSVVLLTLLFVPGLVIAVLVKLSSQGPVFYREERVGRYQIPFRIWKFRSMCSDAAQNAHVHSDEKKQGAIEWRMKKHLVDPRITRIGAILRKSSLDEIPQLINVFRGEMSLIGPRPIVKSEEEFYGNYLHYYHAVTPGMSGLWQVSGRSSVGYDKRARLDACYAQQWSLFLDLRILFLTFPAVLRRVGAR